MNTIMIRPFAAAKLLTFAALALGGCHVSGIRGNGDITTETRTVPDFTSVEADGAFTITWSNGPAGLKITTDRKPAQPHRDERERPKAAAPFARPAPADGGNKGDAFEFGLERGAADGRGAFDGHRSFPARDSTWRGREPHEWWSMEQSKN